MNALQSVLESLQMPPRGSYDTIVGSLDSRGPGERWDLTARVAVGAGTARSPRRVKGHGIIIKTCSETNKFMPVFQTGDLTA